jgi:CpeT/CpcT family (DUF1001)
MAEHPQGRRRMRAARTALLCGALSAGAVLLGCAAHREEKSQELDFAQMMRWLPGTYSSTAQHDEDVKAGKPPHEALAIAIVPVDSPIMGVHTFYLQESAADDPRRVMVQQVLTFEIANGKIKESLATLVEPRRWRDGQLNPELFTAMVTEDIVPLSGCDLFWTRVGERFVGADEPLRCHTASHTSEAAARTLLSAELKSTELALSEQSYDGNGALMQGRADDPLYRFRKGNEHKQ